MTISLILLSISNESFPEWIELSLIREGAQKRSPLAPLHCKALNISEILWTVSYYRRTCLWGCCYLCVSLSPWNCYVSHRTLKKWWENAAVPRIADISVSLVKQGTHLEMWRLTTLGLDALSCCLQCTPFVVMNCLIDLWFHLLILW